MAAPLTAGVATPPRVASMRDIAPMQFAASQTLREKNLYRMVLQHVDPTSPCEVIAASLTKWCSDLPEKDIVPLRESEDRRAWPWRPAYGTRSLVSLAGERRPNIQPLPRRSDSTVRRLWMRIARSDPARSHLCSA